jgi:hypothetical protein
VLNVETSCPYETGNELAQVETLTLHLRERASLVRVRRAAGLVVVALAAFCPVADAQTTQPKVTLIGDSVADQLEHSPAALARLQRSFRLDLQTRGCRRLVVKSCTIVGSDGPPPTVVELVRKRAQRMGKITVIDVGYNDDPGYYGRYLDTVMRALRNAGVQTVVWLTLRDPEHVYQPANWDIRNKTKKWPQLVIADWDGYSADHPEWFREDGIHPTDLGVVKLGQFIHAAVRRATSRVRG